MTKSLEQQLKDMQSSIQKEVNEEASFSDLFPDRFIQEHSRFNSIEDLFEQKGFKCETEADFDSIDINQLDAYIKDNTDFKSWEDMKQMAGTIYMKGELEKLGLDVRLT